MPTLMIQGCTSDAGKSTMVTGLCRLLARAGVSVAPFKPQNMALNSAVTVDGGEIGRAQATQALAAGIAPHTDHNPVLIKPSGDCDAQLIIHGHPVGKFSAAEYQGYKRQARVAVMESYERLRQDYEWVIVEGAGSPAEINLRENDIANMGFAEEADCPVWLVADIDRGGVFAHFVGTLECLSASERQRIEGFIVNRFRGDINLLLPGNEWLEQRTNKPVLGVVPYLQGLRLPAEDALPRERASMQAKFRVVVPALPRISNHTDFDSLRYREDIELRFIGPGESLPACDLIILPGTKNTRADLAWLRAQGWDVSIRRHLRYGGKLIGICGGFQMLGTRVADPLGIEAAAGAIDGLALLDISTQIAENKHLSHCEGVLLLGEARARFSGYRIHHGVSTGAALAQPLALLGPNETPDGVVDPAGQILGTYIHGIFDQAEAANALLAWAGCLTQASSSELQITQVAIDQIADAMESAIDWRRAGALAQCFICP